jgi:drug/metabolite transporter (DMT)-like permease
VIAAVLTLGVVCTAIAFLVFFALIGEAGPVRATVVTYINPAVAVALGVTLLHEHFTVGIGLGFVLVLAGSVLATWRGERGQPDAQAQPEATAVEIAAIER